MKLSESTILMRLYSMFQNNLPGLMPDPLEEGVRVDGILVEVPKI